MIFVVFFFFRLKQDNCKNIPNTDQEDFDKNGVGNACDFDSDGDRYPDYRVFFFLVYVAGTFSANER